MFVSDVCMVNSEDDSNNDNIYNNNCIHSVLLGMAFLLVLLVVLYLTLARAIPHLLALAARLHALGRGATTLALID